MDNIIAGALFDFTASLTTREPPMLVSAHHECAPQLIGHLKAWAKERGLSIEEPDMKWEDNRTAGASTDAAVGAKVRELVDLLIDATEGRR